MAKKPATVLVSYIPSARQQTFHLCTADEAVYGGAKGGGKSCSLVIEAALYGSENAGAVIYLFRETFDDLEANLIREWKEKVPKEIYKYNESKHVAYLYNGSVVFFRYVMNYDDADRYRGRSMDFIGVDELTKHEERTIQVLLSCLRSPKGFKPRFRGTCNPGGIGHTWVKERYIIPTEYGKIEIIDPITGNILAFIPASVYDNDVLMKNDPAYVKRLENLPENEKRAFLYGDWDIFSGQAFPEYSRSIHVVQPFPIPPWWRRWIANDPGYTDPYAWYWMASDQDGTVYVYREFTRVPDDEKLAYSTQGGQVAELSVVGGEVGRLELDSETGEIKREHIDFVVTGMDAFNKHPETGKSIIDYYRDGGLPWGCIPAIHGQNTRKIRKATLHEYLKWQKDENTGITTAKLKIFNSCKKLVEILPNLVTDEKNIEVVQLCSMDHWYDGLTYGLCAWHADRSPVPFEDTKPKHVKYKEKLAKKHHNQQVRVSMWN